MSLPLDDDGGMQWFEREFRFPFPVDVFPGILERLRGLVPRVRSKIDGVPTAAWVERIDKKWSAQENIGHLLDLEDLWSGRVVDFLGGVETLRPADLENRRTYDAEHNARDLEETVAELEAARNELLGTVEGLEPGEFGRTAAHPRLGQPMRLLDHLYFVAEHDDHHLARVHEILRRQGGR